MARRTRWHHERPGLSALLARWLPERQLMLRGRFRVHHLRLTTGRQLAGVAVVLLALTWIGYTSNSVLRYDAVLASRDEQIDEARSAAKALTERLADAQLRLGATTDDLSQIRSRLQDATTQNANLKDTLANLENGLKSSETDRAQATATGERLQTDLASLRGTIKGLNERGKTLRASLDSTQAELQAALSERNQARTDGSQLKRQIKELESRVARLHDTQGEAMIRLALQTVINLDAGSAATGPNADKISPDGKGGPFIAAKAGQGKPETPAKGKPNRLDAYFGQWQELNDVLKRLPLGSPLETYQLNSAFGKRRDPVNGILAMHYGLDLAAKPKTPVLVTAPGIVVSTGWEGRYGRLVEVDHGGGLKTRYAHLAQILVKKGQKLSSRDSIGLIGSSGRSTGTHVHYEVLFNDRPMDPSHFLRAGQYVFKK
ncbi:MAG: hypothetical protein EXQ90_07995 [Rhodospirillales bacterium]|nr:hypothetical protein [Rhodospirillales bacterium]